MDLILEEKKLKKFIKKSKMPISKPPSITILMKTGITLGKRLTILTHHTLKNLKINFSY